jgi:hypothetical protein
MATALTPTALTRGSGTNTEALWTAIAGLVAAGATIDCTAVMDQQLEIRVICSSAAKDFTIAAPTYPYSAGKNAALVTEIGATTGEQTFFIDSVDYKDARTGLITLAFESGMTGYIAVFTVPQ